MLLLLFLALQASQLTTRNTSAVIFVPAQLLSWEGFSYCIYSSLTAARVGCLAFPAILDLKYASIKYTINSDLIPRDCSSACGNS